MEATPQNLHVAVFSLDKEPALIVPAFTHERKVELFRTYIKSQDGLSRRRAAKEFLGSTSYNLSALNVLGSLDTFEDEDGTVHEGYALQVAEDIHSPSRNFSVRKINLSTVADYVEQQPGDFDPIERVFLERSFMMPLVESSLRHVAVGLRPLENQR